MNPVLKLKKTFETIWQNIISSEGIEFYIKTGLSFTYEIQDKDWVYISRSKYPISKDEFEKCYTRTPEKKYHCL